MCGDNVVVSSGPGARFSKTLETFRARKALAKSRTLRLQNCFIDIFLIWTEVSFIQEVSGAYTSPFSVIDQWQIVFGPFEKRATMHDFEDICDSFTLLHSGGNAGVDLLQT